MEMITGALFMLCCVLIYDKFKPHKEKELSKMDTKQKEREREMIEHFDALMNYTPEVAYRKVKQ